MRKIARTKFRKKILPTVAQESEMPVWGKVAFSVPFCYNDGC